MSASKSIKYSINNMFNVKSRARKSEFWWFLLLYVVTYSIVWMIDVYLIQSDKLVSSVFALVLLVPMITVSVRRLHDIGYSGWWLIIAAIPYLGGIFTLIIGLMPSQVGENKYGWPP